jgi:hypothetical protein
MQLNLACIFQVTHTHTCKWEINAGLMSGFKHAIFRSSWYAVNLPR